MTFGQHVAAKLKAARNGCPIAWTEVARIIDGEYRAWQHAHRARCTPVSDHGPVDPLFAALCTFEQIDLADMTPDAKRKMALALGQIRKASPEVTPDDIARRGSRYLFLFKGITPTAHGLAANWARCYVKRPTESASDPVAIPVAAPEDRQPNFFSQIAREGGILHE